MSFGRVVSRILPVTLLTLPLANCSGETSGSPVEEIIAFTSDRDGNLEIYVMKADGSDQVNLTNNPGLDWYPDVSPDGTKVLFGSYRNPSDDDDEDIFVMNTDGTDVTNLTNQPSVDMFASWSPSGSKIAFASYRDGIQDLYIMNADGTGTVRITDDPEPDFHPRWSPDGSRIVYMRVDPWPKGTIGTPCGTYGLDCEIYVVNVDGLGKTNLTSNSAIDGYPDWSPDGRRIVFNREVYRGGHEIVDLVTTNPDGTGLTQLTLAPLGGGVPRWSPDGSRIVFQFEGEEETLDIFMINADGSNPVNLTRNPSGNDWYASW